MSRVGRAKIVIAGSFGYRDIGDEAMLTEDLRFIHGELGIPKSNVTLFGYDTAYLARYHDHPAENCIATQRLERLGQFAGLKHYNALGRAKRIARSLLARRPVHPFDRGLAALLSGADAALVTGGGTINTREPSGFSLTRMATLVRAFKHHDLPLFISGQTIGPLGEYPHHDALAREIVEAADVVTVRDHRYSRRYLDLIGAQPKELIETFDDAYTLDHQAAELPEATARFLAERPAVVVNITDYTSDTFEQQAHIARLVDWLAGERGDRVLLLSHTPRDQVRLFQIYDMCQPELRASVHLPDAREWSGSQLKKAISLCRLAIGGRYHFIVFAGTTDTPFVGMAGNHYSYVKQHGFAEPIGLSRFVLTERETRDFDTLTGRIAEAEGLSLHNAERFSRPSVSMRRFGSWFEGVMGTVVP
ncbi:MAG: polysaccharide pyruvyl transferase family protein [Pseudomonadota bacterium]